LALIEGCKHSLDITVPSVDVKAETARVVETIRKKARLPGFRPGKAPESLIRSRFAQEIRTDVLEKLVPKYFHKQAEEENLKVVGQPNISDVHFHDDEDLHFKIEFEVSPEFELKEYRELPVVYKEPEVTAADVDERVEKLREQKADYVNIDPRPAEDGDFAVVSLRSLSGGPSVDQPDVTLQIGGPDTLAAFSDNLRGMSPEEEKEFDVVYPEDFGNEKLAGKTVRFQARLTVLRRKELPETNDEFAKDLGDFQSLEELKEALRKNIFAEREHAAQQEAKDKLVSSLVESHDFAVPDAFVENQVRVSTEQRLRMLQAQGIDISKLNLDWEKLKESQKDQATKDVKASLLLDKIATTEHIDATVEDIDREVQRIARQEREAPASVRRRLEQDGTLRRVANHFRTEKTLSFLFEQARKTSE
jgi:trigger factor